MRCTYTMNLKKKASKSGRFKLSEIAYKDNIGLSAFNNDKGSICRKLIVNIAKASDDYWKHQIPKSYIKPIWFYEAIKKPLSKKIYSSHIPLQRYSSRKVSLKEKSRGILYESYQTTFIE